MTKQLNENLSFESFLGDFSAELVNLTFESIDTAINLCHGFRGKVKALEQEFGRFIWLYGRRIAR